MYLQTPDCALVQSAGMPKVEAFFFPRFYVAKNYIPKTKFNLKERVCMSTLGTAKIMINV